MIPIKKDMLERDQKDQMLSNIIVPISNNKQTSHEPAFTVRDFIDIHPKVNLCIAADKFDDESHIRHLQALADKGIRIYLLLGDVNSNSTAIERLSGRCLIRCGVSQKGSIVLGDVGTNNINGCIHQNTIGASGCKLDPNQCDDMYRAFCSLFWKQATHECIEQNVPSSKIADHPVEEIHLNHQYNLPQKLAQSVLSDLDLQFGSFNYWSEDGFQDFYPFTETEGCLLLHLSASGKLPSIEKLCNNDSVSVRFVTFPQENILITPGGGWYLPAITDNEMTNWALSLNSDQSEKYLDTLDWMWSNSEWELKRAQTLGSIKGKVRFADKPGEVLEVIEEYSMDLEPVEAANIDEFLEPDLKRLFSDQMQFDRDRLAHTVKYSVVLHPPYLPEKTKEDPLVREWNVKQEKWKQWTSMLGTKVEELENCESGLSERIKLKLSGFLAAQGQKVTEFNSRLNELKEIDLGRSSPALLERYITELNDLDAELSSRLSKNKSQKEMKQKEVEWEDKHNQLDSNILINEKKITDKESEIPELEASVKDLETKLQQNLGSKQNKKIQKELDRAKKSRTAAISAINKAHNEISRLKEQKQKLGDRFVSGDGSVDEGSDALGRVLGNKQLEETFDLERAVEFLPPVGMELYSSQSTRWLVIKDLKQVENARKPAKDLNAKICVKRGV